MLVPELPFAFAHRGGCAGVLTYPDQRLSGLDFAAHPYGPRASCRVLSPTRR